MISPPERVDRGSALLLSATRAASNTTLLLYQESDRVIGFNDSRINTLRKIVGISNEDGDGSRLPRR